MPPEVVNRFKAIKVLYDGLMEYEDEMETEMHQLEIMFEQLYADLYRQRDETVNGTYDDLSKDLIIEFNEKAKMAQLSDNYKETEVANPDINMTIGLKKGVGNFWVDAMLNHPNISKEIQQWDIPILAKIKNIKLELHENYGFGFDLIFVFERKGGYFVEESLTKKFVMSRANCIERAEGTKINWKAPDPTMKKVKRKRKGTRVTVNVEQPSFFKFFRDINMPSETELEQGKLTVTNEKLEKDEVLVEETKDPKKIKSH